MEYITYSQSKVYEVKYNDFGIAHVVAKSFEEAGKIFELSEYGTTERESVTIHSIFCLHSSKSPLISTRLNVDSVAQQNATGDIPSFPHTIMRDKETKEWLPRCNTIGCKKTSIKGLQTMIGGFCSEKHRQDALKAVFRALI